jgi:hypothetical protein
MSTINPEEKMIIPMQKADLEWVRKERNRPECRAWFRQPELITQQAQEKWFDTTSMLSFVVVENNKITMNKNFIIQK